MCSFLKLLPSKFGDDHGEIWISIRKLSLVAMIWDLILICQSKLIALDHNLTLKIAC